MYVNSGSSRLTVIEPITVWLVVETDSMSTRYLNYLSSFVGMGLGNEVEHQVHVMS